MSDATGRPLVALKLRRREGRQAVVLYDIRDYVVTTQTLVRTRLRIDCRCVVHHHAGSERKEATRRHCLREASRQPRRRPSTCFVDGSFVVISLL